MAAHRDRHGGWHSQDDVFPALFRATLNPESVIATDLATKEVEDPHCHARVILLPAGRIQNEVKFPISFSDHQVNISGLVFEIIATDETTNLDQRGG